MRHEPGWAISIVLLAAAGLMIASLFGSQPAKALSCRKIPEEQSRSLLEEAVLIFQGMVVSVSAQSDNSTLVTARILELYQGDPQGLVVSFKTPLRIRGPEVSIGVEIGKGDRGLVILSENENGLVQTNLPFLHPWPEHWKEHMERLQGGRGG